jgi:DNA-directed RNA polymerase specialized sigma24 family protein
MTKTSARKMDAWATLRAIAAKDTDPHAARHAAILEARDAGWSYAAIGSALGISAQAVHSFVHRREHLLSKGEK